MIRHNRLKDEMDVERVLERCRFSTQVRERIIRSTCDDMVSSGKSKYNTVLKKVICIRLRRRSQSV